MRVVSYNSKTKAVREKLLPYLKNTRQFEIETKKNHRKQAILFFLLTSVIV